MNRLARLYAAGLGVTPDPVEAAKWHIRARQAGISDLWLDGFVESLDRKSKDAAMARAYPKREDQPLTLKRNPVLPEKSPQLPKDKTLP